MTYGLTPTPRERTLAHAVWNVIAEAHNKGQTLRMPDLVTATGIGQGLPWQTRCAYVATGIHWARHTIAPKQGFVLGCDRSTGHYYLTQLPVEARGITFDIMREGRNRLKTIEVQLAGLPKTAQTKPIRVMRKTVERLIEDIDDEITV